MISDKNHADFFLTDLISPEDGRNYGDLQQLLLSLATGFIGVSPDDFDDVIAEALKVTGTFLDASRLYLFSYDFEREVAINTYDWTPKGASSKFNELQSIPLSKLTDVLKVHLEGKPAECSLYEKLDIQPLMLLPVSYREQCLGFLGIEASRGADSLSFREIFILKALATMIASAELRCREEKLNKKSEEKLAYLSMHDRLTGLYNRNYFDEELMRLHKSRSHPVTIIYMDINGLKVVNDALGHDQGDKLIIAAAKILRFSLRSPEVLARVGGDEFAAVLVNTGEESSKKIVSRIRSRIEAYNHKHKAIPLSLSIGSATANNSSISLEDLMKTADDLMYRDKIIQSKAGRFSIIDNLKSTLLGGDFFGVRHSNQLARLCDVLGRRLDLSSEQLPRLALLSKTHDLGKADISEKILLKKGKLMQEERKVIQLHPEKGYRMARASSELSGVADLILKHHEWWDGKGYPYGLKGNSIPIECRILAVVVAYVIMTRDNTYKKARSNEEALAEIKHCAGTQFDPEIVKAFSTLYDDVKTEVFKEHSFEKQQTI